MEELISKYLNGEASEEEMLQIEEWVKESAANRKEFARLFNIYALTPKANSIQDSNDLDSILALIKKYGLRARIIRASFTIAASVLLLVGAFFYSSMRIEGYKREVAYVLEQQSTRLEYSIPFGVKSKITLPDSSVVWLNSGSKIAFPSKFTTNERLISFSGEGYFEIKSDPLKPMKIEANDGLIVNVLGTSFNLATYSDDNSLSLLLLSGKVNIKTRAGHIYKEIVPSQKIIIDKKSKKHLITEIEDPLPTTGWKSGWLIFDDLPLSEAFVKMKRWYGITIKVNDQSVLEKRFSAKFKEESASQVLDLMHKTQLINYTIIDSVATISNYSW